MAQQLQPEPRFKKRVPCDLVVAGTRHPGIVLNLSRSGLFVQTAMSFQRGDWVAIDLNSVAEPDSIELEAVVMWNRHVAAQLRGVRHGGIGLKIRNAGRSYYDLLTAVSGNTGGAIPRSKPAAVSDARTEFRVRVGLRDHPRSKTLLLRCENEGEARGRALSRAGDGDWEILEVAEVGGNETD